MENRSLYIQAKELVENPLLQQALKNAHWEWVEHYLEKGVLLHVIESSEKLNVPDHIMTSIFALAFKQKNLSVVEFLLENNSAELVNSADEDLTFFLLAVKNEDLEKVRFYLEKGVDVNVQDSLFNTPVLLAIERENLEMASLLIEKGADVNATGDWADTALRFATKLGNESLVNLLLRSGARVDEDILYYSICNGIWNPSVAKALFESGAEICSEWLCDVVSDIEKMQFLLSHGANPSASVNGLTPLHLSIQSKSYEVAELLIKAGADLNVQTFQTSEIDSYTGDPIYEEYSLWTPLHFSIQSGNSELFNLLIDSGADVNIYNDSSGHSEKETPLLMALNEGQYGMAKRLIQAGSDVNAQNGLGFTALKYIADYVGQSPERCSTELIQLFLECPL